MSMTLEEADTFLGWNKPPTENMKISVDKFIVLTTELLQEAGFNVKTSPTVVQVIINQWDMKVILPADKNDEGAYQCADDPDCWLKSVTVDIDNTGATS